MEGGWRSVYREGNYVVYGINGVCRVQAVEPIDENSDRLYYRLTPVHAKRNVIFTPVDNQKVPMRLVLSEEEANRFLKSIDTIEVMEEVAYKQREQQYKEAMKTCDCRQWVCVMKTAYDRRIQRQEEGKKATAADEKYFKEARSNLINEMEVVFDQTADKVVEMLSKYLEFI